MLYEVLIRFLETWGILIAFGAGWICWQVWTSSRQYSRALNIILTHSHLSQPYRLPGESDSAAWDRWIAGEHAWRESQAKMQERLEKLEKIRKLCLLVELSRHCRKIVDADVIDDEEHVVDASSPLLRQVRAAVARHAEKKEISHVR